ncbi:MAG: beta-ketoacyl-[acyl-carrier-protein] synthase II, partial [Chloroflexota bacterium]|nr:beta-ketoacyl-[acyl-carrier-protein] synthase II [Chloroflexota bacterium]
IKGAIGHCMAAAGALEFMSAVRTLTDNCIPPTRNHRNPDPEICLDIVGEARTAEVEAISKHSFGLGGQNAVLILRRWRGA